MSLVHAVKLLPEQGFGIVVRNGNPREPTHEPSRFCLRIVDLLRRVGPRAGRTAAHARRFGGEGTQAHEREAEHRRAAIEVGEAQFGHVIATHLGGQGNGADRAPGDAAGVVAVLELARLFSTLYHQPRNRVAINFLFLLTGGSHFNFAGTDSWLSQMEKSILDRIDFAICLDSIGNEIGRAHV